MSTADNAQGLAFGAEPRHSAKKAYLWEQHPTPV